MRSCCEKGRRPFPPGDGGVGSPFARASSAICNAGCVAPGDSVAPGSGWSAGAAGGLGAAEGSLASGVPSAQAAGARRTASANPPQQTSRWRRKRRGGRVTTRNSVGHDVWPEGLTGHLIRPRCETSCRSSGAAKSRSSVGSEHPRMRLARERTQNVLRWRVEGSPVRGRVPLEPSRVGLARDV